MRFASARRLGFPVLRASTTTTPFVRLLPRRYDREHDPFERPIPRCSGGPRRRVVHSAANESLRAPDDFRHPSERRVHPRRSGSRSSTFLADRRRGRESEPCVRRLHHSCERLASPARAESPESRSLSCPKEEKDESPDSKRSSISWSPIVRPGVWRALPRHEPAEDTTDVSRPAKGNERASASRCFPSSVTRSRA